MTCEVGLHGLVTRMVYSIMSHIGNYHLAKFSLAGSGQMATKSAMICLIIRHKAPTRGSAAEKILRNTPAYYDLTHAQEHRPRGPYQFSARHPGLAKPLSGVVSFSQVFSHHRHSSTLSTVILAHGTCPSSCLENRGDHWQAEQVYVPEHSILGGP